MVENVCKMQARRIVLAMKLERSEAAAFDKGVTT